MPAMNRRTFLTAVGVGAGSGFAGCATVSDDEPPAGSLQFTNRDSLPHAVQLAVTDVGSELDSETRTVAGEITVPAPQRNLTATEQLPPEEATTYTGVFTEPIWYAVECTVDGHQTSDRDGVSQAMFHPAPPEREYVNYLQARIRDSGRVELAVVTTDTTGRYAPTISE